MDYERKYKEALERAKGLLDGMDEGDYLASNEDIENIFPELKESEDKDEIIRQCLIEHIKCNKDLNWSLFQWFKPDTIIAWLEKQGEKKHIINVPPREVILSIWDLGNEWKELTNGCISTEYGNQLDYIQKHWHESEYYLKEKQGKQAQLDYEHADIPQKDFVPIKPKFKVGDWIIFNGLILRIDEVVNGYYTTTSIGDDIHNSYDWDIDNIAKLWTIEDAKDGDVLVDEDNNIGIYEGEKDDFWNSCIYLGCDSCLHKIGGYHTHKNTKPATKKQHDLLFQKMKEAGYEWDAQKKELKKIRWCDEHPVVKVGGALKNYERGYEEAIDKACDWLEQNAYHYCDDIDTLHESALIGDFRYAMKGE